MARHTLRFMNPHYSQVWLVGVWGWTVGATVLSRVGGTTDDNSGGTSRSGVYAT